MERANKENEGNDQIKRLSGSRPESSSGVGCCSGSVKGRQLWCVSVGCGKLSVQR